MWKWKKLDNYQMNILYPSNNHTLSLEIFTSQKEEKRLLYQEQYMMCDVKTNYKTEYSQNMRCGLCDKQSWP